VNDIEPPTVRDHLANARTLLAWIRTALTVIGLGFLVDRLAAQGEAGSVETWAGIVLVLLGAALALAGAYSYLRARRELSSGTYRPAVGVHLAVVAITVLGALLVVAFLLSTRPAGA
jgi:putative membrane protein